MNLRKKLLRITRLYTTGKASDEQKKVVEDYYDLFEEAPTVDKKLSSEEINNIGMEIFKLIQAKKRQNLVRRKYIKWIGAAAVLFITFSIAILWTEKPGEKLVSALPVENVNPLKFGSVSFTRNLSLPDGTKIVLHRNSQLEIHDDFITGKTREVVLNGEAFFDVKHDASHPFIIHTGNIRTTVLGTAFNIRAYKDGKVNVSVIRGRVKVEEGRKLLAVLTKNKQVTTDISLSGRVPAIVSASPLQTVGWASQGMQFDNMPFGKLAEIVGQRYGAVIKFRNQGLKNCPITGSFSGTESLEEILKILSQARGTTFSIEGNQVYIDGRECL